MKDQIQEWNHGFIPGYTQQVILDSDFSFSDVRNAKFHNY